MASAVLYANLLLILTVVSRSVLGEIGCPPPEDVEPCICSEEGAPVLRCSNIMNADILVNVFRNSERYSYSQVHISYSAMQYIPSIIFSQAEIHELHLNNTTVYELFEKSPETRFLQELHISNSKFLRSFGTHMSNLTNLKVLTVHRTPVRKLGSTFSSNLPRSLRKIIFRENRMTRIYPGALSNFPNLDKFAVISNSVHNLSRSIFPTPFNVRFLTFDNANITSIPEDLFSDMPNLQFLSMQNNEISAVPQSAFSGRSVNLPVFRFDGNPLRCDCLLVWIIKDKPEILGGECSSPARLRGRDLRELSLSNFNC